MKYTTDNVQGSSNLVTTETPCCSLELRASSTLQKVRSMMTTRVLKVHGQ